jgi:5-aminolevulinate synthase
LKRRLTEKGIPFLPSVCHIIPIIVGDAVLCKQASDDLLRRHHIYVQPINYPTVPKGTERLRITPTPLHDDAMMDHFMESIVAVWSQLGLKKAA